MSENRPYPGPGHALLMTGAVVALQLALGTGLEMAGLILSGVLRLGPLHLAQHPGGLALVNTVALGSVIAWGVLMNRAPPLEVLPLRLCPVRLALPILLAIAGGGILLSEADNLLRWFWPMPRWLADLFSNLLRDPAHRWSTILAMVVVAPLTEELLFRGVILRGLAGRYSLSRAVLFSSVLFGLFHFNPWQFVSATLLGALFAWWRWRTGSLLPCLAGHAFHNALIVLGPVLPLDIPGFSRGDPFGPTVFQPAWFDACGVGLLLVGLWLFGRWTRHMARVPAGPPAAPPVLAPPVLRPKQPRFCVTPSVQIPGARLPPCR